MVGAEDDLGYPPPGILGLWVFLRRGNSKANNNSMVVRAVVDVLLLCDHAS